MREQNIGVLGVGAYMPEEVRTNDWWKPEVIDRWRAKLDGFFQRVERVVEGVPTPGEKQTLEAIEALRRDPFQGALRRHVMAQGMRSSEMETHAAAQAI